MCPFQRVDDRSAGASALGILVPPSRRTFLILRPRSLAWDLLLCRDEGGLAFREMPREEASGEALSVFRALEQWSRDGPGQIVPVPSPTGQGFRILLRLGRFALAVCRRVPGQPYAVEEFADLQGVEVVLAALLEVLRPGAARTQEVYFNTRHFS